MSSINIYEKREKNTFGVPQVDIRGTAFLPFPCWLCVSALEAPPIVFHTDIPPWGCQVTPPSLWRLCLFTLNHSVSVWLNTDRLNQRAMTSYVSQRVFGRAGATFQHLTLDECAVRQCYGRWLITAHLLNKGATNTQWHTSHGLSVPNWTDKVAYLRTCVPLFYIKEKSVLDLSLLQMRSNQCSAASLKTQAAYTRICCTGRVEIVDRVDPGSHWFMITVCRLERESPPVHFCTFNTEGVLILESPCCEQAVHKRGGTWRS